MKAIVIQHVASEDLGNLKPLLTQLGFSLEYIKLWQDDFGKFDPMSAELMVVLGGPIGVYNTDLYPRLANEIEFVKRRISKSDLPTLGICLGSQIIAHCLGAKVFSGENGFELGFHSLNIIDQNNDFFANLNEPGLKVLHWHGDTFEIPPQTKHLASSSQYSNQAFTTSNYKILGLQFHLEVAPEDFEGWLISNAPELMSDRSINIPQLRQDNLTYGVPLQINAIKFWQDWLNLVLK